MPKKYRYLKEKIDPAATGCSSMTDSFERLALLYFSIIILITQAVCEIWFHRGYS